MNSSFRQYGFTLIEVMIAMAIVGFGLMAILTQISQTVSQSAYLRDKTLAIWIAQDQLTAIRLKDEMPKIDNSKDEIAMVGMEWRYTVKVSATDRDDLRRIDIDVGFADRPDTILASISGFMAEPPAPLSTEAFPGDAGDPNNEDGQQPGRDGIPNAGQNGGNRPDFDVPPDFTEGLRR